MTDVILGDGDKVILRPTTTQQVNIEFCIESATAIFQGVDVAHVPLYSQRDPTWSDDFLGYGRTTIGNWGCVVTSIAALLTYHGATETPATVNQKAKERYGFHNGNLFVWESVARIWSGLDVVFAKRVDCQHVPAPIEDIDLYLAAGQPVIVYVDFDHEPGNGLQTHFVLVVDKQGDDDYIIMDPWHGDLRSLVESYGDVDPRRPWMRKAEGVIQGVRFYRKL